MASNNPSVEETGSDVSKELNSSRGVGPSSRIPLDFNKLRNAGWLISERKVGSKTHFIKYVTPEAKTLKSAKDVERKLCDEGVLEQFLKEEVPVAHKESDQIQSINNAESSRNTQQPSSSDSDPDYEPPTKQVRMFPDSKDRTKGIDVTEGLFVGTTSSIVKFVGEFNRYFRCPSNGGKCKGKLVLVAAEKKGLGGGMKFFFKCSGCWVEEVSYQSSQLASESRRQMVSLALCLAFFISGHGFKAYHKTLGRGLGLGVVTENPYLNIVGLALPHIKEILNEMCEEAKEEMRNISGEDLGSWGRAVTTCDGCWQIRGHFSQNCTFIIKNYLTGALLYYGHLSMRGADNISSEELWQGTAKAAEGHLAQILWAKAKDEGMKVEVNWQDADSSSAKGFRHSFANEQEAKIMLCGGHVGRAHGKKLQEIQGKSSFSQTFINLHKGKFPQMASLKCDCSGKKHSYVASRNRPSCGCMGPAFIQGAKRNHYCALVQAGTDPEVYRNIMLTLGSYHCRDIHEWEGGSCTFHPLKKCSCKGCKSDVDGFVEELKCAGEPYHSPNVLKCEFHALAYEIECHERAKDAEKVISPELGKGHSNLPESTFSVLTKFRAKDINLHKEHYEAATNLGLIQANMTWCYRRKGPQYHWITELYSRLGLPILDGIREVCQADNEDRMKRLERKKTEAGKRKRVQHKINRTEEQTLRKKYVQRLQIRHSYGDNDEDEEDPLSEDIAIHVTQAALADGTAPALRVLEDVPAPNGAEVEIGGKKCKWCGSTTHLRKSHKDCPYNSKSN